MAGEFTRGVSGGLAIGGAITQPLQEQRELKIKRAELSLEHGKVLASTISAFSKLSPDQMAVLAPVVANALAPVASASGAAFQGGDSSGNLINDLVEATRKSQDLKIQQDIGAGISTLRQKGITASRQGFEIPNPELVGRGVPPSSLTPRRPGEAGVGGTSVNPAFRGVDPASIERFQVGREPDQSFFFGGKRPKAVGDLIDTPVGVLQRFDTGDTEFVKTPLGEVLQPESPDLSVRGGTSNGKAYVVTTNKKTGESTVKFLTDPNTGEPLKDIPRGFQIKKLGAAQQEKLAATFSVQDLLGDLNNLLEQGGKDLTLTKLITDPVTGKGNIELGIAMNNLLKAVNIFVGTAEFGGQFTEPEQELIKGIIPAIEDLLKPGASIFKFREKFGIQLDQLNTMLKRKEKNIIRAASIDLSGGSAPRSLGEAIADFDEGINQALDNENGE